MYITILFLTLTTYFIGKSLRGLGPFYFLSFILILFSGFRGEFVGRDTQNYHNIFNSVLNEYPVRIIEYGYLFFLKIIIAFGGTQQLVFLIFAGFTIFCFSKFIIRYSKNPYLSLIIFILVGPLYLSTLNQIRQYLAIGIFLAYLIPLIQNKKFVKFILITFASAFFVHASSILLIPFYFLLNRKISLTKKIGFLVLFNLITGILISLILMTPYGYFIINRLEVDIGKTLFAIQLLISFFILWSEKYISFNQRDRILFYNMAYFSLFFLLPLFISENIPVEIFIRMNNYFFPFIIILIPDILERFTKTSNEVLTFFLITFLSLYFYRNTVLLGEFYNLVPYEINIRFFDF